MFNPQPVSIDPSAIGVTLKAFLSHLQSKWKVMALCIILGLYTSLVWRWVSQPAYEAQCTFVLEEKGGGGGLSGLASQFGFDLGALGGGSDGFFSSENLAEIMTSTTLMNQVLLSKLDSNTTLADRYLDASGMRQSLFWGDRLNSVSFAKAPTSASEKQVQDTALLEIRKKMLKKDLVVDKTSKKGTIFGVSLTSSDPMLARVFTERLVAATGKMYIDIKTRNQTDNIARLEKRADSLRRLFGDKSVASYTQQVLDANDAFKTSLARNEISARDKTVVFEIYAEVMKNIEVSKMMLINQTPVIQVLDQPETPLADTRFPVWKLLVLGILLGFGLGVLVSSFSFRMPGGQAA